MQMISKVLVRGVAAVFGLVYATTGGVVGTSSAFAQSGQCGCLVAAGTTGIVQSAHGNVFVSQASGSVPAQVRMQLQAGNSVLVGPQSSSTISFGNNCTLRLAANTALQAIPQDGQLCLAVNQQAPAQAGGTATANAGSFVTPETIFGGIVAGGAIMSIADDSKSVSK
ncbi:hypothetical protein [Aquamicrobium soli]|uniref:Secreted protein n=1 Tax=Aquamicrobium soli TaxID=1811518 RepID=A0ABV7KG95_9HYPH